MNIPITSAEALASHACQVRGAGVPVYRAVVDNEGRSYRVPLGLWRALRASIPRRRVTPQVTALLLLAAALVSAGCAGIAPQPAAVGLDTRPEGPAVRVIQASGDGATVAVAGAEGSFAVSFPAVHGKPAAIFSFPEIDINDRLGLALDIRNRGRDPLRVYADLNGDTWVRGGVTVAPGNTGTLYVFARRKKLGGDVAEQFPGMHGVPGGKMSLWAGIEEPIRAKELRVFVVAPPAAARIEVSNLRPFGSSQVPELPNLFPFIDRYGQYKHRDWPGKVHADSELTANLQREEADLAAHPGPGDFDQYGGWAAGPQLPATGHFRVEKYRGRWWFVDPEGRLFWSNGIDCVGFSQSFTAIRGREHFYEDVAPRGDFLARNLQAKYGTSWRDAAADRLLQRIRSWGLNTLGGSADQALTQKRRIPYTPVLRSGGRNAIPIDPYSASWADNLRQVLTAAAANLKDDPWCIGFFVDNEIHVSSEPTWWERYYRQVNAVAKEVMPNILYFGSRLDYHDWPDEPENRREIVRIAAKYCDVIGFNFYKFTVDDVVLPEGVDRPALIGEFHFGALDRGLFHTGLRSVVDQIHRAEAYRVYVTSALRNPAIVGAHWFQCYDEATTGRFDGENYQIGFLDICDTPYVETVAAAREVGYRLYAIRAGKEPVDSAPRPPRGG